MLPSVLMKSLCRDNGCQLTVSLFNFDRWFGKLYILETSILWQNKTSSTKCTCPAITFSYAEPLPTCPDTLIIMPLFYRTFCKETFLLSVWVSCKPVIESRHTLLYILAMNHVAIPYDTYLYTSCPQHSKHDDVRCIIYRITRPRFNLR